MLIPSKKKKKEKRDFESQTVQTPKISDQTSILRVPNPQNAGWLQRHGLPYRVSDDHHTLVPPITQQNSAYANKAQETHLKSTVSLPAVVYGSLQAASKSVTNLSKDVLHHASAQTMNHTHGLIDAISSKLDTIITCIDGEGFVSEQDLLLHQHSEATNQSHEEL